MNEDRSAAAVRAALDEVYRPAPGLLASSMAGVRAHMPRRRWTWTSGAAAAFALLALAALLSVVKANIPFRNHELRQPASSGLPQPTPAPVTRTGPGAQVAWLSVQAKGQQPYLIGIDPAGRQVGRITAPTIDPSGYWRSADGNSIFSPGPQDIASYSAMAGTLQHTYPRMAGSIAGEAFSPDGRFLALLISAGGLHLQVIDLGGGVSQTLSVPSGGTGGSVPIFAPDSTHLYTLTNWEGPTGLNAFSLEGGRLRASGTALDGQGGRQLPTCNGPAMATKVVSSGAVLVAFCHSDGVVWFFDLSNLNSSGTVHSEQPNPFWLSPIFTPDGRLLYLHQPAAFGDKMQVVDLATHKLLGPIATPMDVNGGGPFAWIATDAYAGGVASTEPVSPDGLKLYSAGDQGVTVLRIPDLKPLARLAQDVKADEVWVSGDGQTLYLTSADRTKLVVMNRDGSRRQSVSLPAMANGFVASEHG